MKRSLSLLGLFFLAIVAVGSLARGVQGIAQAQAPAQPPTPVQVLHSHPHKERVGKPSETRTEVEDDEAVYRHSKSVALLGRWLHLDTETASKVFEYSNFAILAGAILYFVVKYLPKALRARRESIQKDLLEARTLTEQAHGRLKLVEQKFARLEEEIAGIRTQSEQESAAEEARIKALIETEKQRIIASAEQEIAAAAASSQRELKRLAAELAVHRATQMLSLSEQDDRLLVQQFSRHVSEDTQKGERN